MVDVSQFELTDHAIEQFISRFQELFNKEYSKEEARKKYLNFLKNLINSKDQKECLGKLLINIHIFTKLFIMNPTAGFLSLANMVINKL